MDYFYKLGLNFKIILTLNSIGLVIIIFFLLFKNKNVKCKKEVIFE